MKRITSTNHCPIQYTQRCKKAGSPITFIVMRHCPTSFLFHRQSGLCSIQSLYLRFFIDTQNQSFIRRIQIQTNHIGQFFNKPFVLRQFKCLCPVRLQTVYVPNPRNTGMAYPQLLCHFSRAPLRRVSRCTLEGYIYNSPNFLGIQSLDTRTMWSVFRKPQKSFFLEALSPEQNSWTRSSQFWFFIK